jgi:hypothetical protein
MKTTSLVQTDTAIAFPNITSPSFNRRNFVKSLLATGAATTFAKLCRIQLNEA